MENKNTILQELQAISAYLAGFAKKNPYEVSRLYFDNFATEVLKDIKQDKEPWYYFSSTMPWSVPENYFTQLPAIILKKAASQNEPANEVFEEMQILAPLLNTINKKPVYTVPDNYLAQIAFRESRLIKKKAKVVSFTSYKRIVRFAAAAAVAALLTLGIFIFTGKQDGGVQVSKNEVSSEMKKLSEDDIIDFLKTNSPTDNMISTITTNPVKDNDIKKSVSEMSDNEIQQFLQENGEQDEI